MLHHPIGAVLGPGEDDGALDVRVLEQVDEVKRYPPAAERIGLRGTFDFVMTVDAGGTIQSGIIQSSGGHSFLRRTLELMINDLTGRRYGAGIGKDIEIPIEIGFGE